MPPQDEEFFVRFRIERSSISFFGGCPPRSEHFSSCRLTLGSIIFSGAAFTKHRKAVGQTVPDNYNDSDNDNDNNKKGKCLFKTAVAERGSCS